MQVLLGVLLVLLIALFAVETRHNLKRDTAAFKLVEQYEKDLGNPALVDAIVAFIEQDWKLKRVWRRENGTKDDVRGLIKHLMLWGNMRKGRRFIPITSFFYVGSLEYLLQHKDGEPKQLAMKMMQIFHF
ncbi:hypothetical protein [Selenomonas sp.]|uniref:hypothetical protein n=1 Tax=Selenomonas sp. TaxID=2053611 RepID=UPI0025FF32C6|nr:hypothetical protein [Selenomonas sp.]MCI6283126.1 hypothetical protein [Selenomonas sp.]MDY3298796.1 hypothetical protein [Selenomonas sp.]MDY4416110.1 hypothetical protein [Selenomonas sp.]